MDWSIGGGHAKSGEDAPCSGALNFGLSDAHRSVCAQKPGTMCFIISTQVSRPCLSVPRVAEAHEENEVSTGRAFSDHSVPTAPLEKEEPAHSLPGFERVKAEGDPRSSGSNPTGKLRLQEGQSFLRPPHSSGLRASQSRRGRAPP